MVIKRKICQSCLYIAIIGILAAAGCNVRSSAPFSESAVRDLSTFQVAEGFKIELIASEPVVRDPVDMMIDEYGRMSVVEMPGMPLNRSGLGDVVLLSDTDGDGKMDKRTVFADSLVLPSGVMRWKKGVVVTDPPNVYYFEDSDNDGIADIKRVMLTGFDTSNLEANVNNPEYGIDNWIYLCDLPVGGKGGIHFADDPSGIHVPESSSRFQPDSGRLEVLSGQTQFGQAFDTWGHHLMVNNSNHIYQDVIAARYLQRNPDMITPSAVETLAGHREVFPITKNPEYQMLTDVGVFTSACGIVSYQGGAFSDDYNQDVTFVCEPVSNVVHADRLVSQGVTYKANRILEKSEFLASTDPYARLVNLYIGPDGALYVVDFYRQVIEGPEFMAKEVLDTVDLYNGTHKGRIYRISREGSAPPEWTKGLRLGDMSTQELVDKLTDKNIWWRLNAQRLLVGRNDNESVSSLIKMTGNIKSSVGRLHALWTLEGMHKLTSDRIKEALKDPEPGIRENAVQLAELHLESDPSLAETLLAMENDADPKVRFQLLLTLGNVHTIEAGKLRQQLLFNNVNDKWMQIAALSATSSDAESLLNAVLTKFKPGNRAYASLIQRLSAIIGTSQPTNIIGQFIRKATAVGTSTQDQWQAPLLEGLAQGLKGRKSLPPGITDSRGVLLRACLRNPSVALRRASLQMLHVIGLSDGLQTSVAMQEAAHLAHNAELPEAQRACAIDFLALQNPERYAPFLKSLVDPREPLQVQLSAINVLKLIPGSEISQYLLSHWSGLSPGVRSAAIGACMMTDDRIELLLDAIESGKINLGDVSWSQSVRLRSLGNMALRMRSRELFARKSEKLKSVLQDYRSALSLEGNASEGKKVFQTNCAVCHQIAGKMGRAYGPDLGTVHAWAPADIMTNILDPNRSIAHGYDTWDVSLNNGESVQGIVSAETPTAITISDANGQTKNIARQDIKSLKALGISAMPVGFEEKISQKQMADLLMCLRQGE